LIFAAACVLGEIAFLLSKQPVQSIFPPVKAF
jgi:energy-converting hydrogenase Eha subunit C